MEINKLYNMDCIEGMNQLPDNYVDLILTDPPYNTGMTHEINKRKSNEKIKLINFFYHWF